VRIALDTNLLVYAEGGGDDARREHTRALLQHLDPLTVCLPLQVLGELHRVLTRKYAFSRDAARAAVESWIGSYAVADSTLRALQAAMELAAAHGLGTWDSLVLAVAAEQRCRVLLSEDMQDGFTWSGVTVVNPFTEVPHPLLARAFRR
jgi:predicted nucleic acid-binding protein